MTGYILAALGALFLLHDPEIRPLGLFAGALLGAIAAIETLFA